MKILLRSVLSMLKRLLPKRIRRLLFSVAWFFYNLLLRDLPSINLPESKSVRLRLLFLRPFFKYCGVSVNVQPRVVLLNMRNISIGDCSGIGAGSRINADAPVTIGKYVMVGPELIILTSNHKTERGELMIRGGGVLGPVTIEDDVWIGTRVIILPGVTIARGCVIGAGAVVTKSTEPYGIYGGVPARKIKSRA